MFWVQQKDRYLRQILIRDIQELSKRRLVVYFANRFQQGSDIDQRDIAFISEIFGDVGEEPIDLMLETNGGSTDATESIISFIQNIIKDFRVVVTSSAKSNGTLIALAANTILMGPTSELGPIEPSVQNIPASILTQQQIAQTNYPLHMFGVYALQQSKALAKKLLSDGMMSNKSSTDIDIVVQKMSSRDIYSSHGSTINYNEAKELGLNVIYLDENDELWKRMWLLHCMYEYDCGKSKYLKIFEGQFRSTAIAAI